jgi:hypothetical protein
VPLEEVCLILGASALAGAKPFLDASQGRLADVSGGSPKSVVVSRSKVFLSAVSAAALISRADAEQALFGKADMRSLDGAVAAFQGHG